MSDERVQDVIKRWILVFGVLSVGLSLSAEPSDGLPAIEVRVADAVVATLRPGLAPEEPFEGGFSAIRAENRDVDSSWEAVWGDRRVVSDRFHEENTTFRERGPKGRELVVAVRRYPEGVAVRMTLPSGGTILDETTEIEYPGDAAAWMIGQTEDTFPADPIPLTDWKDGKERLTPFTVRTAGGYSSFLEAYAVSYPRCRLERMPSGRIKVRLLQGGPFDMAPGASTPWRAFIVGRTPGDLIMNATLVANLNPPCAIEDTSWIRPGLRFSNLANCPLREEALECAADHERMNRMVGAQLDWGWYGTEWDWSDEDRERYLKTNPEFANESTWRDNTRSTPRKAAKGHVPYLPAWKRYTWVDLDISKYIGYLRERGMGLSLYVRGRMLEKEDIDDLFGLYERWGLEGVKPGFVRYGDIRSTDWNRELIRLAAKHRLTVDIHDAWLTDGIERTYPNLLISEGGGGEEGCHPVRQDVTLPFTRCLAGPFDFTPKFFRPGASHAHMAAMLLVYPGPTAIIRGTSAARFGRDRVKGWEVWGPEREFVKSLPMNYDESKVLEGEIGRFVTVARRKGDRWYVAGVNGSEARQTSVRLDFLPADRTYELHLAVDDLNSDSVCRMAREERRTVRSGDVLRVSQDAAGGFVAVLEAIKAPEFPEISAPRAITSGPHDHFLANYFAINAWSADLRYVAVLETDINGRLAEANERITLGLVDTQDGNRFIPVTTTACWNFQEATMFHWLPQEPDTFIFNDIRDGRFVSVIMNWKTKAERIIPCPVSAVSRDGTKAVSLNYARLYLTRPDYGYAGDGQDAREKTTWPEDDGLWLVDLRSGNAKLILSVAQGRMKMPKETSVPCKPGNPLAYYCHTVFNPSATRIFFLARSVDWYEKETHRIPQWLTTAFTVKTDGTDLRRCFADDTWGGSHFHWLDDRTMAVTIWPTAANGRKFGRHVKFTVGEEEKVHVMVPGLLDWDGHCVWSPNGKWMSTEGYYDGNYNRQWAIMRASDEAVRSVGEFFVPEKYRSTYWRCDLHARWRPDGRQLAFNSVHEGARQVYVMDVVEK